MSEQVEERDWYGTWINDGHTRQLIERSEEYIASLNNVESTQEPTSEERILALEQALLNLLG